VTGKNCTLIRDPKDEDELASASAAR